MHAQAHTHAFTHAHTHSRYACMHTCACTHTHTREREHGMYMYIATYTCVHAYTHTYIHMYVSFLPDSEKISQTTMDKYFSRFCCCCCSWQDQCVWSNWKRRLRWWWYFVISQTVLWKIALLCWRPGSQQRFKISLNVFPGDIFWTIQPFVAKHGLVFHHHGPVCLVKRLFCYHQGQSSAHIIKLWLFLLYLQSCWLFCN